jgi:hypothetical protein
MERRFGTTSLAYEFHNPSIGVPKESTYHGRLRDGDAIGKNLFEIDALLSGSVGQPARRAGGGFLAGTPHRAPTIVSRKKKERDEITFA